jgi:hypothetical protein
MRFTHAPGDRPLDNYVIKNALGRGGFGEVYHALSDGGKEVALKLVQRNLEVELRGVSHCLNLKHPNLVALYDVKQADNGDHWIVMEFVQGDSLDRVLSRNPQGLPPEQVLTWLRGIGDGVSHLHECGIVHRDLKPGNIFLENEVVKIGDYGLAKFISASKRSGQTGSVGTVHYMAPEVVNGRYGKEVDLYAVGVILYEMLTGKVPFDGESAGEILMKHLTVAPDLSPLPPAYRAVVARLLAKDPFQRYSSFKSMLADLEGYVASPPAADAWAPTAAVPMALPATSPPGPAPLPYHGFTPLPAAPPVKLGLLWYFGALITSIAAAVTVGIVSGFSVATVALSFSTKGGRNDEGFAIGVALGIFSALLTLGLSILLFHRWSRAIRSVKPLSSPKVSGGGPAPLPGALKVLLGLVAGTGVFLLLLGIFVDDLRPETVLIILGIGLLVFGLITFLLFRLWTPLPGASKAETPPPAGTWAGQEARQTGPWQSVR